MINKECFSGEGRGETEFKQGEKEQSQELGREEKFGARETEASCSPI